MCRINFSYSLLTKKPSHQLFAHTHQDNACRKYMILHSGLSGRGIIHVVGNLGFSGSRYTGVVSRDQCFFEMVLLRPCPPPLPSFIDVEADGGSVEECNEASIEVSTLLDLGFLLLVQILLYRRRSHLR